MGISQSVDVFLRTIQERTKILVDELSKLLTLHSKHQKPETINQSEKVFRAANDLNSMLVSTDSPHWLKNILRYIDPFKRGIDSVNDKIALESTFIFHDSLNKAKGHVWNFEEEDPVINFDQIFNKYRDESKIPQLLDEIVKLIESLIESKELDSIQISEFLKKIVRTIKKNKGGSYFSLHAVNTLLSQLLKNVTIEFLKSIPVLGPIIKGLEKTIKNLNIEMNQLDKNFSNEIRKELPSKASLSFSKKSNSRAMGVKNKKKSTQ